MSFSRVYSAQINILDGQLITVETDISKGLHNFAIVGLADKAVDEARDRVGAAIKNSGLKSPKQSNQKIVISLSPANLKKEGSYFDLAIALHKRTKWFGRCQMVGRTKCVPLCLP